MAPRKADYDSWISETPDKDGFYHAFVSMGPDTDGKPDRRHVKRKSLASVRDRVKELERARDAGRPAKKGKPPTVQEMVTRHIEVTLVARKRAVKTIQSYTSLCKNWIFPLWGSQRIDRLRDEHIDEGVVRMLAEGLGAASVRKVLVILSSAYELQVKRGNVARNPCLTVDPPPSPEGDGPQALTEAEARRVIAVAVGRANSARWCIGLACGLRQGEALGLRWEYLNIDVAEGHTGSMRIWWQLQRLPWVHGCAEHDPEYRKIASNADRRKARAEIEHACGKHKVACPKRCPKIRPSGRPHVCVKADDPKLCKPGCTKHAAQCPHRKDGGLVFTETKERRHKTVPIPAELVTLLREHRDAQFLQKLTLANQWADPDPGLVFTQWNGQALDPRADWQEWSDILKDAKVPHVGTHGARHSAATFAIEEGIALPVVQEMLGHSDIRVTQRYVTVSSELADDAARRMGRLLRKPDPEP